MRVWLPCGACAGSGTQGFLQFRDGGAFFDQLTCGACHGSGGRWDWEDDALPNLLSEPKAPKHGFFFGAVDEIAKSTPGLKRLMARGDSLIEAGGWGVIRGGLCRLTAGCSAFIILLALIAGGIGILYLMFS